MIVTRTLYVKLSLSVEEVLQLPDIADEMQETLNTLGYDVEINLHGEDVNQNEPF